MALDLATVSAVTALVAVIVGPLVSVYVAKKQIRSSIVSTNRQKWIDRLRDELAALLKDIQHTPSAYSANSISTSEAIAKHGEITERVEVIKLLINPKEADHQELVRLISSANSLVITSINQKRGNAKELQNISQNIASLSQQILKREWERVKSGE
jgi:23S rRNA pseudoU1915 N3-methylase RlmH